MNVYSAAFAIAVLAHLTTAQTLTSPTGYLSFEGPRRSSQFGTLPSFRAQVVDGEYRGRVLVLKSVGFRQESAPYSSVNQARSWSSVSLKVADGNFLGMGQTFSANYVSSATTVFSGSVNWPPTPVVQTVPQQWQAALSFPFRAGKVFTGNRDILYDWQFSGGRLANNGAWSRMPIEYNLDSYADADQVPATIKKYRSGNGCRDSKATWTQSAWSQIVGTAYGPNWSVQSWRNKLRFSLQAFRTGPNATVVHALDYAGVPAGVSFPGISCDKLFLQLTPAMSLFFTRASSSGLGSIVYPTGTPNGLVTYQPIFAGFKFWTQATWTDTGTGAMLLTDAVEATLPLLPKGRTKHKSVFANAAFATSGSFPRDLYYYNRIMRLQ